MSFYYMMALETNVFSIVLLGGEVCFQSRRIFCPGQHIMAQNSKEIGPTVSSNQLY
jgi:hypothetical protein